MALTYVKESHRVHGTVTELALCPACFAQLPAFMQTAHGHDKSGYKMDVRPWRGEDRECSYCPERHEPSTPTSTMAERR